MKKGALHKSDMKLMEDIKQFGWHVVKVLEDENNPGFCYSIGLYETFGHPEIIVVGLKLDLGHLLINNIGFDIRSNKTFQAGKWDDTILENYDCTFIEMDKKFYREYLGFATWYYEHNEFPVLQLIYPSVEGYYPWSNKWPKEIEHLQPVLGKVIPLD